VPADASAIVMNVTATDATAGSYLTVYPHGTLMPNASNINFGPGETIANLTTVGVGGMGSVVFANAVGATHVVVDVVGYYDNGTTPGDRYTALAPTRIVDSRTSPAPWDTPLTATPRDLVVRGASVPAVPANATAIVANLTVTNADLGSFVTAWPAGSVTPNASNINFGPGQTIASLATIEIGAGDAISLANAVGGTDIVIDVVGYYAPDADDLFHPLLPTRILDDRVAVGLDGPWGPGQTRTLAVGGAPATNVPGDATAIIANLTATNATTGSYLTVFPTGTSLPTASNLHYVPGDTIAVLSIPKLGPTGSVDLYNHLGTVDLIADTTGYFSPF
jgi:hypothetical protein